MGDAEARHVGAVHNDPAPVEWINADSQAEVLLLCEHAGQAIPSHLYDLGLPKGAIDRHIGWDIGAEKLARAVAEKLDAPLILQRYSRLVLDCNRPPHSAGSIPEVSDTVVIPANQGLDPKARAQRQSTIFDPLNDAIQDGFLRAPRRAGFSIHTFTRQMQLGERRTWDAGILCRRDLPTAQTILESITRADPALTVALNEPYQIEEDGDWFIPQHAEPRGLRHSLIEVCNDQVETEVQVEKWAELLAVALRDVLAQTR
ncbi:hypothetical protein ROLI_026760 [Roseobacter fucihabitans]|uniref:N-formylglutamate amidohydrolase n=1 Tax=Roseobacter fucihabitans TaxID=1537242 RepID=A0ABZ2BUV6_9RHOB|nr:N-formylglutamate amidohydrolase [Roseobacter litoralis]MBC6967363.1 N-formylglutamate amidohydrolase [Roseobacter litoralis]